MQILSMTSRGRESTKLCGDFAVYITSIIMMLITILLMIEDRCNTSFAINACYVHIYISFIIDYTHMRAKFGRGPTAVSKKVPFNFISR